MGRTTIHCVRHAQGYHNLTSANHALRDPSLTEEGIQQCTTLSHTFPAPEKITDLVASPLRRTISTCLLSFPTAVSRGLSVIALPEIQETSDLPCDRGSSRAELVKEFGGLADLSLVGKDWNNKKGKWSPAAQAIESRAREARIFLRSLSRRPLSFPPHTGLNAPNEDGDREIVVVTHGGFLHYFTEDWEGNEKFSGTGWANTEWRSYRFVDERGRDEDAGLVETQESRRRRRGNEKPLSAAEQRNLKASAERELLKSGLFVPAPI